MKNNLLYLLLLTSLFSCKQLELPKPYGAIPTEKQLKWQEMEYYAFIHFSMNTFNDVEWGYGNVDPSVFNPSNVDCRQWARVCKEAGMKGIILTAKHHDGFCLWPSKYTDYSVKNSSWKNGKGDLVRELSEACKEYGLKLGIYLSPWDRNHPQYGKPEYITYFRNQLRELLTNYGDVFEIWFDGANGGTGYYGGANEERNVDRKTYYDWPNTYKMIYEIQPNAMLFSDAGPDCRWCGNEEGWVGETNWSTLRRDEVWPGSPNYEQLRYGHEDGTHWLPAEVNVSTRPGWFYHKSEDHKVKTLSQMLDIYYKSFGRNGTLLVNFPVDRRGLIHENDADVVIKLAQTIQADFAHDIALGKKAIATNVRQNSTHFDANKVLDGKNDTYWATDDNTTSASLTIDLKEPTMLNRLLVQEYIKLGQRVKQFEVEVFADNKWQTVSKGTTIGYKRILTFSTVKASKVRLNIIQSKASPLISTIGLYNASKVLISPTISRDKNGNVQIQSEDKEIRIYYTIDGSEPNEKSLKYETPFVLNKKVEIKAVCYDELTGKKSPVCHESFGCDKSAWKVIGVNDDKSEAIFDGNPFTTWHQKASKMPIQLVVDLSKTHQVCGFKYLPDQQRWSAGIIFNYQFFISQDGTTWKLADSGEFSNIKNSPVWQVKKFESKEARFVKLVAVNNTDNNVAAGYAEFDVVTE